MIPRHRLIPVGLLVAAVLSGVPPDPSQAQDELPPPEEDPRTWLQDPVRGEDELPPPEEDPRTWLREPVRGEDELPPPAPDPRIGLEGAVGLDEDLDLAKYSINELVERASDKVGTMEKWLTESFYLLEASLSAGDVNAANTRNEAITVMKGLVKLSEQNLMTMRQKAAEGDRRRVENEYVKITIAHGKVQVYYAQVKSAESVGVTNLDLSAVERRLVYSGQLPVVDDLPASFAWTYDVFIVTPSEPVHASPYF